MSGCPSAFAVRATVVAAVSVASLMLPVAAAERAARPPSLAAQVQALMARVQQLEQSNQALSQQVRELSAAARPTAAVPAPAASEARLQQLESRQQTLAQQVQVIEQQAASAPADDDGPADEGGLSIEGAVVAVAQQVNARGSDTGRRRSALNYRGDLLATLPLGSLGEAKGTLVGHLRFGQGTGVATLPTHSSTVNSTAFEVAAGSDETYAIVAEAHYTLDWSLGTGGFNDQPGDRLSLTVGKMDFFGFFDQNDVAADESTAFMNNAFVHNPLLDSGGDIAADAYGFAPGARLAYVKELDGQRVGLSVGVFASGLGATFGDGAGKPLVAGQMDWSPLQINGEPRGTYRLYVWTNGRTTDLDGNEQRHSGWGVSADQRVGAAWNLFGRFGQRTSGDGAFDRALTLGFEHAGRNWGRPHDALGLAVGWLRTDDAWRDATADESLAGYAASGDERIAELYYRIRLADHLDITPDYQFVQRAGGNGQAPRVHVLGLRATLGF